MVGALFLLAISSLSAVLSLRVKPVARGIQSRLHSLSLGSDLIERPDDENSPEFREYLKALLTLQANRAKTGHAAPSSGSSDAYLAKLSRIKLERNARREAGLPDDDVDTSYTQQDYQNALMESSEPAVSANSGGGRKVRELTREELAMQKAAEERVMALVSGAVMTPKNGSPAAPSAASTTAGSPVAATDKLRAASVLAKIKLSTTEDELISQVIGGKVGRASAVQLDRSGSKIPTPAKATPSTPVPVAATKPEPAAAPEPPAKQSAGAPQVSSSFREVVENAKKNLASVSAKSSQQPAKAEGRKLDLAELDVAATALQLLVRHRGGGPFGSGRLEGKEAEELGTSLKAALAMLQKDASSSESTTAPAPSKSSVEMASSPATTSRSIAPSPVAAGNTKPTPSTTPQVPPLKAAVAAPTPMPAPVAEKPKAAKSMVSASEGAAAAPGGMKVVTIAEGLDSFLLAPKEVSTEDLKGLRDGIIHCLGLIQAEILSRPLEQPVQPSSATAASVGSSPTASKTAPPLSEGESLDKQLKVAMGLLLKHRGGPSFGHGRLQGEELSNLEQRLQTLAGTFLEESEGSEGGKTVLKIFDN